MLFYLTILSIAALLPGLYTALVHQFNISQRHSLSLGVSVLGSAVVVLFTLAEPWNHGVAAALRLSIFTTSAVFYLICWKYSYCRKLTILLFPYLLFLAVSSGFAGISGGGYPSIKIDWSGWTIAHVIISLSTYATITLAAIAALAVTICQIALKAKKPNKLTSVLPAINQSDSLQFGLLMLSAGILAFGLLTGMVLEISSSGNLLRFDHKTLFTLIALILIVVVAFGQRLFGIPGMVLARLTLSIYLFLSLGYIGVKVVYEFLI